MNSQRPSTGSLDSRPLFQLLLTALERGLSGSLVLETPEVGKNALTLERGKVVKIKTAAPVARIGTVAVGAGMISQVQLEEMLRGPHSGLLGDALVSSGMITQEQLRLLLSDQVLQQVDWIAKLPRGTIYGFYPGQDYLARWGGQPREIDPLQIIWRCVRAGRMSEQFVQNTLAALPPGPVRLHAAARVRRFGFDGRERALVDVLRAKPQPADALIQCGLLPEAQAKRVLVALTLTRHVDVGAALLPLGVSPTDLRTGRSTRPREVLRRASTVASLRPGPDEVEQSEVIAARLNELQQEVAALLKADFYNLLGVPAEAATAQIQTAFLSRAKQWHPDKLDPELRAARDQVTKVFARMTEAHQVLTNAEQRADYDRLLQSPDESAEDHAEVQKILRAASTFQKAEILVKRGEWAQALESVKKAHEDDPEQAEYEALYAWLLSRQVDAGDAHGFTGPLQRLMRAVKAQPNNVKVRLYRARVFRAMGKVNEAMRDYRTITEQDPNNVEAQRELRLHRMRTGPTTEEDGGGLFGKLFKK